MNLLENIPFGRANAITAKELMKRTDYPDVRTLQHDIHNLRVSGKLIVSSTNTPQGYYRPETKTEIAEFCHSMNSRIREIKKAVAPAMEYLQNGGVL